MKLFTIAALATLSLSTPVFAQETKAAEVEATEINNANDVAITMTNKMVALLSLIPDIKDEAGAKAFSEKATALGPEITKLAEKIKTFDKPTEAEFEAYAKHSVEAEKKITESMTSMFAFAANPENQALAQHIQAGMAVFGQAAQGITPIMEEYYPQAKLKEMTDKIKAEQ